MVLEGHASAATGCSILRYGQGIAPREGYFARAARMTDVPRTPEDTDRPREEPRDIERRFQVAVRHTLDMIQEADFPGDRMTYHGDIDTHFGYEPGGFPRTVSGLAEFVHPDDREYVESAIDQVAEIGEWHLRYRVRAADGTYRHILDQGTVLTYLDDGAPNEAVGAFSDQTQMIEREEQLRQALDDVGALKNRLAEENLYLRRELRHDIESSEIIGDCAVWRRTMAQIRLVAATDSTVLIAGETGTGKELLAQLVHSESQRRDRAMIKVNCAALPSTLIESELFGHERGAFSGAERLRKGRFELADQGTILLDEIGEMPLELQPKLLRVLETGEFERVGSSETRRIDARVIAVTNRDLEKAVEEGRFRSDLFYRLAVFPAHVPPLRSRREDIPLLANYFLSLQNDHHGKAIAKIPDATMAFLEAYDWPGNVRELENLIERAVILSVGDTLQIDAGALQAAPARPGGATRTRGRWAGETGVGFTGLPPATLEEVERVHIVSVLESCGWKVKGRGNAAEILGLNESTLRSRMKRLGVRRP